MINFHEEKLWQQSYVALMDLHIAFDEEAPAADEKQIIDDLLSSARRLAGTIADSLTRRDGKIAKTLRETAVGEVAMTRTHLAVAWGRGLLDDEMFRGLDEKYASLSDSLQ